MPERRSASTMRQRAEARAGVVFPRCYVVCAAIPTGWSRVQCPVKRSHSMNYSADHITHFGPSNRPRLRHPLQLSAPSGRKRSPARETPTVAMPTKATSQAHKVTSVTPFAILCTQTPQNGHRGQSGQLGRSVVPPLVARLAPVVVSLADGSVSGPSSLCSFAAAGARSGRMFRSYVPQISVRGTLNPGKPDQIRATDSSGCPVAFPGSILQQAASGTFLESPPCDIRPTKSSEFDVAAARFDSCTAENMGPAATATTGALVDDSPKPSGQAAPTDAPANETLIFLKAI